MNKDYNFYDLLNSFKNDDDKNKAFEEFFMLFTPLLEKYAYKLGDKDTKYFLAEALFNALNKIPYEMPQFKENKFIINYISKSIKSAYIKLSQQKRSDECLNEYVDGYNVASINHEVDYNLLIYAIQSHLDAEEYKIFSMRYIKGYSEKEIAKKYSMSRQAINKRIRKTNKKIQSFL